MRLKEIKTLVKKEIALQKKDPFGLIVANINPFYTAVLLVLVIISITGIGQKEQVSFMMSGMAMWLAVSMAFIGSATSYLRESHMLEALNPIAFDKRSIFVAGGIAGVIRGSPGLAAFAAATYYITGANPAKLAALVPLSIGITLGILLGGLVGILTTKRKNLEKVPYLADKILFISSGAVYSSAKLGLMAKGMGLLPHAMLVETGRQILLGTGTSMAQMAAPALAIAVLWLAIEMIKEEYQTIEVNKFL